MGRWNRRRHAQWGLLCAGAALLAGDGLPRIASTLPDRPPPIDDQPGEPDDELAARRSAWILSLHRHAPGLDWRAQDADYRTKRWQRQQDEIAARLAAGATAEDLRRVNLPAIAGTWVERGSGNQAGRITATVYDAANDRLTVLASGGQVWRAGRVSLNWASTSDTIHFDNGGFADRLAGAAGERLLVASDAPVGLYRSDNGGASWQAASGLTFANPYSALGLAVRDAAANDVYLLRSHYDFGSSAYRPYLSVSSDRGTSFSNIGFVGQNDRTALFSPRYDSSEVYLLVDAQLKRIVPGTNAIAAISTIPFAAGVASGDRIVLRGGVSAGVDFLYAFHSRPASGKTDVYRSTDAGQTWAARTSVPTTLFGANAAETSPHDPNVAYAGGINTYRSADGALTWTKVNDWTEYYGNPSARLHADIPSITVWTDAASAEHVFIGTDGGVFESTDNGVTVHNLSANGLRVSQYYGTYTRRAAPYQILVGAQDQGYQKALAPSGGIESFVQTISGDYAHLASSDGGATVWMVYPGFVQVDTTTGVGGQGGLRSWNFGSNQFRNFLFLAPLAADPANANRISLAGGNLNSTGHRIERLTLAGGTTITASEDAFDFTAQVTAIAYSTLTPTTRYAINGNGGFFRDTGAGWAAAASGLPGGQFFYGNALLADPVVAGRIYVGGAGYSNPGVYVSNNNGDTFQPMATGLPATLVYGLAISPDGRNLFAATELGPYYYDLVQNAWVDLSGLGAPSQIYWDVDFVAPLGLARFSTYGRGVWDFVSPALADTLFSNGFE